MTVIQKVHCKSIMKVSHHHVSTSVRIVGHKSTLVC